MGIAVRDDQDIPRCDGDVLLAREAHDRLSVGKEVIADQPLGSGGKHVGDVSQMRYPEPPGRRALRVVEDGAGHAHGRQRLR